MNLKMMWIVGIGAVLSTLVGQSAGQGQLSFRAYNCSSIRDPVRPINMVDIEECPDIREAYNKPEEIEVMLLKTEVRHPVAVHVCGITVTKRATYCSSWTHGLYPSLLSTENEAVVLSPEDCMSAFKEGKFNYSGKVVHIKPGLPGKAQFLSHGSVDKFGNCYPGQPFTSSGKTFSSHYEEVFLSYALYRITGYWDFTSNQLKWEDHAANYSKGHTTDDSKKTYAWRVDPDRKCSDSISLIYNGKANLRSPSENYAKRHHKSRPKKYLIIERKQQFSGLVLNDEVTICEQSCFRTQLEEFVVCPGRIAGARYFAGQISDATRAAAKTDYLALSNRLLWARSEVAIHNQLCKQDQNILKTKFQILAGKQSEYVLTEETGKGHSVVPNGAVAYDIACPAVEVKLVSAQSCTVEIPVRTRDGQVMYADPISLILRPIPTVLPCSPVLPVMWKINQEWYCSMPDAVKCEEPDILQPTDVAGFLNGDWTNGIGESLYSPRQLAENKKYMDSKAGVNYVSSVMAIEATRRRHADGTPGIPFSDKHLAELKHDIMEMLGLIGEWTTYFFGVVAMATFAANVFNFCIRFGSITLENGLGWHSFKAFSVQMWTSFRTPNSHIKNVQAEVAQRGLMS